MYNISICVIVYNYYMIQIGNACLFWTSHNCNKTKITNYYGVIIRERLYIIYLQDSIDNNLSSINLRNGR